MGERMRSDRSFSFNRSIRLAGHDEHLSSNAGVLLLRELDERWRTTSRLVDQLDDPRRVNRSSQPLLVQLRTRIFALAAGFSSQREAVLLASDPLVRLTTADRRGTSALIDSADMSQPTLARTHHDRRSKPETIFEIYRRRGTSESRFGELKSRLEPKLSCTIRKGDDARQAAWRANASTYLLYMLADGMLHALRWLSKDELSRDGESLPRLQRVQRLIIDVGARVTRSTRRIHVHVAETASDAWVRLLSRLARLRPVT